MAVGRISLNFDPHELTVGREVLRFVPEIEGPELIDLQNELADWRGGIDQGNPTGDDVRKAAAILRTHLSTFMLPESQSVFAAMKLPVSVLQEIFTWTVEVYSRVDPTDSPASQPSQGETPTY